MPPATFLNNETLTGVTGGANGSGGVQKAILATAGSIGYVSPDFVQPVDTTGPQAANVQTYLTHLGGKTPAYEAPTPAAATLAMQAAKPPVFTGASSPASDQLNWGQVSPLPANAAAYAIAGFSFIDLYSCYAKAADVAALVGTTGKVGYLTWYYGASSVNKGVPANILAADGFAPVPATWATAINKLLTDSKLGIATAGTKGCKTVKTGA